MTNNISVELHNDLVVKSRDLRLEVLNAFYKHGEAHLGGSFSIIEILIWIYEVQLRDVDKFILSKSHASFPMCLILNRKGLNARLTTHLEIDKINGIHCTTGSLGHGLPIAAGMALAKKFKNEGGKIIVAISDGECQEGTTWETLLIAASMKISNLLVLIDYNKFQALGKIDDILPLNNLHDKFKAFNWDCIEVEDGHDFYQIANAFSLLKKQDKPTAIIFNTIKGKGVKDFENDPSWHAKKIRRNEYEIALKALSAL
jgi:transketolase